MAYFFRKDGDVKLPAKESTKQKSKWRGKYEIV